MEIGSKYITRENSEIRTLEKWVCFANGKLSAGNSYGCGRANNKFISFCPRDSAIHY